MGRGYDEVTVGGGGGGGLEGEQEVRDGRRGRKERSRLGTLSPRSTTHAPDGPGGVLVAELAGPEPAAAPPFQGHLAFRKRQGTPRPVLPARGGGRSGGRASQGRLQTPKDAPDTIRGRWL